MSQTKLPILDSDIAMHLAHKVMTVADVLAACSAAPDKVNRTLLTPEMLDAQNVLADWMGELDLDIVSDGVMNIRGRYKAKSDKAKSVVIGSHYDTVPNAGKYDGTLGILLGLAMLEAIPDETFPFHIDVIGFSEEEGIRFRRPYIGSKSVIGKLGADDLALIDHNGLRVVDAIEEMRKVRKEKSITDAGERAGLINDGDYLAGVQSFAYPEGGIHCFFEPHIEQGPVLESHNFSVGCVTGIVGQNRSIVEFVGLAGHAGTVPMAGRKDATLGASELNLFVEEYALKHELRATCGAWNVRPNVGNVIPAYCSISLDVRNADQSKVTKAIEAFVAKAQEIGERRNLEVRHETRIDQAPVDCDTKMTELLDTSVRHVTGIPFSLPSGAGHDAVLMSQAAPVAMLFIRSLNGGISHHPAEKVAVEDVAQAIQVMVDFMRRLKEDTDQ